MEVMTAQAQKPLQSAPYSYYLVTYLGQQDSDIRAPSDHNPNPQTSPCSSFQGKGPHKILYTQYTSAIQSNMVPVTKESNSSPPARVALDI